MPGHGWCGSPLAMCPSEELETYPSNGAFPPRGFDSIPGFHTASNPWNLFRLLNFSLDTAPYLTYDTGAVDQSGTKWESPKGPRNLRHKTGARGWRCLEAATP